MCQTFKNQFQSVRIFLNPSFKLFIMEKIFNCIRELKLHIIFGQRWRPKFEKF